MSAAVILLNVVFSVSVIMSVVGLLLWGIATQRRDHQVFNARQPTRAIPRPVAG